MQTDFSRFSYSPRIFWFRDILSENQSLVHAQWRDNVPLNLSQDYNLLLIFSTPMLMESCTKQVVLENASYSKNQWLPTSRLMMITLLPSLHTINKKKPFHSSQLFQTSQNTWQSSYVVSCHMLSGNHSKPTPKCWLFLSKGRFLKLPIVTEYGLNKFGA